MLARFPTTLVAVLALLATPLFIPASARAGHADPTLPGAGALDAYLPDGTPMGECPLEHTEVSVEISGFVAEVTVTQRFSNPHPQPIEALYTFPLSDRGAVHSMWMRTEDREIRGEIHRREEARRIYERARERGQLASLLDQERPNVFHQSLANLMPGADVEIEIHYSEPLVYADGRFRFAFPTVVGPRFVPGRPTGASGTGFAPDTDRVPDGSRITPPVAPPGTRAGHDLTLAVDVEAGVPIRQITSPLHAIDVARPAPSRARVRLRELAAIPNRDFVLEIEVAAQDVSTGVLAHRDGGDGYLTLILLPPARVPAAEVAPKELVFVVDRSGSQRGAPLAKAKETLHWILDHMQPSDTFQVIDFGSTANRLFARPELATRETRRRAHAYIDGLRANGGTYMAEAIREAAREPADGNRLRIVSFMTDGYIGNDLEVIELVRQVRGTSRWFPFGTGNSVNHFLLNEMAIAGGGAAETVLLSDPGEEVARRFWERISSPVLTDVQLAFRGLDVDGIYPAAPSEVWADEPLIVHARYRSPGRGQVILRGFRGGRPYEQTLDVGLPERETRHSAIASLWARARVDDLLRRDFAALQSRSFPRALREQIETTALAHRLVTPFTSFVAVEDQVVNRDGRLETVPVPVELPDGVSYAGVFGAPDAEFGGPMLARVAPRSGAMGSAASNVPSALAWSTPTLVAPGLEKRAERAAEPVGPLPVAPAPPRAELDDGAKARLSPALLALVQGERAAPELDVRGDRVRVRVTLARAGREELAALARAGLRIQVQTDGVVIGRVDAPALAALAQLDFVVEIEGA